MCKCELIEPPQASGLINGLAWEGEYKPLLFEFKRCFAGYTSVQPRCLNLGVLQQALEQKPDFKAAGRSYLLMSAGAGLLCLGDLGQLKTAGFAMSSPPVGGRDDFTQALTFFAFWMKSFPGEGSSDVHMRRGLGHCFSRAAVWVGSPGLAGIVSLLVQVSSFRPGPAPVGRWCGRRQVQVVLLHPEKPLMQKASKLFPLPALCDWAVRQR